MFLDYIWFQSDSSWVDKRQVIYLNSHPQPTKGETCGFVGFKHHLFVISPIEGCRPVMQTSDLVQIDFTGHKTQGTKNI